MLSAVELSALFLSLKVSAVGTLLFLPLGIAVAWVLARTRLPGKILLDGLVHLPLVIPPVATGYLLLLLFGRRGPVGGWLDATFGIHLIFNWKGAALVAAIMGFPLLVRSVRLSLEALDTGLEAAARTLGASPAKTFLTITLPLIAPGILTGTLLAFARALGEFGATIAFVGNIPGETQTLPLALYAVLQSPGSGEMGIRLVLLSIALAVVALALSEITGRLLRRRLQGEP